MFMHASSNQSEDESLEGISSNEPIFVNCQRILFGCCFSCFWCSSKFNQKKSPSLKCAYLWDVCHWKQCADAPTIIITLVLCVIGCVSCCVDGKCDTKKSNCREPCTRRKTTNRESNCMQSHHIKMPKVIHPHSNFWVFFYFWVFMWYLCRFLSVYLCGVLKFGTAHKPSGLFCLNFNELLHLALSLYCVLRYFRVFSVHLNNNKRSWQCELKKQHRKREKERKKQERKNNKKRNAPK